MPDTFQFSTFHWGVVSPSDLSKWMAQNKQKIKLPLPLLPKMLIYINLQALRSLVFGCTESPVLLCPVCSPKQCKGQYICITTTPCITASWKVTGSHKMVWGTMHASPFKRSWRSQIVQVWVPFNHWYLCSSYLPKLTCMDRCCYQAYIFIQGSMFAQLMFWWCWNNFLNSFSEKRLLH